MAEGKTVDAVSERLRYHKKRGQALAKLANETYLKKITVGSFLRYEEAGYLYYQSSISFKACSRWRQAGDSLVQCAKMHIFSGMNLEAATLYSCAAEVYMKVDKTEAIKTIRSAISVYCEIGRFDIAGRLERFVANTHFVNKHWEEASIHFRKAANFLSGEQLLDQSDICLEKAASCLIELNEYGEARKLFELVAEGCVNSNLRRFNARDYLLKGILCMMALPIPPVLLENDKVDISQPVDGNMKYGEIVVKIDEYEKIDYIWRCSKEQLFLRNLIKARLEWDRDGFADHTYWWNNVHPFDRVSINMLKVVADEMQGELDRQVEVRRQELLAREKAERRKKRLEVKKKLMEEMGMKGEVKDDGEDDEAAGEEAEAKAEDENDVVEGAEEETNENAAKEKTFEDHVLGEDNEDDAFVIPGIDDVKPEPRKKREGKRGQKGTKKK